MSRNRFTSFFSLFYPNFSASVFLFFVLIMSLEETGGVEGDVGDEKLAVHVVEKQRMGDVVAEEPAKRYFVGYPVALFRVIRVAVFFLSNRKNWKPFFQLFYIVLDAECVLRVHIVGLRNCLRICVNHVTVCARSPEVEEEEEEETQWGDPFFMFVLVLEVIMLITYGYCCKYGEQVRN